MSTSSFSL